MNESNLPKPSTISLTVPHRDLTLQLHFLLCREKKDKNPTAKYKTVVTTAIPGYSTVIRQVLS